VPNEKTPNQICTISIVFPIEADDKAIECKKKISEVISDLPEARVDFRIMEIPKRVV